MGKDGRIEEENIVYEEWIEDEVTGMLYGR